MKMKLEAEVSEPTAATGLPALTQHSYSREEAALVLGISVRQVDTYLSRGILEKRQRGRRVVIPVESLWAALHSDQNPSQLAA